jgi:DNA-binding NtrC family response regulator
MRGSMSKRPRFEVVPLARIAPLLGRASLPEYPTSVKSPRILSVSHDPSLAATREMLFSAAGFEVTSVSTIGEAIQLCVSGTFELVVIGHSIPLQQRELLLKEVRRQCAIPTLALYRVGETQLTGADYIFDSAESPELLLETVIEILTPRGHAGQNVRPGSRSTNHGKETKRHNKK